MMKARELLTERRKILITGIKKYRIKGNGIVGYTSRNRTRNRKALYEKEAVRES